VKRNIFEQLILYNYRYVIGYFVIFSAGIYSLVWRLGSLLPGLGYYEADYITSFAGSWRAILDNPLYWPHKALTNLSVQWLGSTDLAFRLPSVLIAAVCLIVFFVVIRHRFKGRVAMVAVALLSTSSWLLPFARTARPEILVPTMILLLLLSARLAGESRRGGWVLLLAFIIGLSLYVPLLPYVVLIGGVVTWSYIRKHYSEVPTKWYLIGYGVLGITVLPLLIALVKQPVLIQDLLAWPDSLPQLGQILSGIKSDVSSLFWSARSFPALYLGNLPHLGLFGAVMLILGIYHLDREVSRSLTNFVLLAFGLLLVLINLKPDPGHNVVLIPFAYLLIAAGIVMLLSQWYEIFPRNPVARMIAFLPTFILFIGVINYHYQRFFVAWTGSAETFAAYPPLSQQLNHFMGQASGQGLVVVTEEEKPIASAIAAYQDILVTSVAQAIDTESSYVISQLALEQLEPKFRARIEAQTIPIYTPYAVRPIALRYSIR